MASPFTRRRSSADLPSALLAAVISLAAFAAVFAVSAGALREYLGSSPSPVTLTRERVDFVSPRSRVASASSANARMSPLAPPARATPQPQPATTADTGATRVVPSTATTPTLLPPIPRPRYVTKSLTPPAANNPFVPTPPPTRAEVDSLLRAQRDSFAAFAARRVISQAERDAIMRAIATSRVIPGRAAQMPGIPGPGGASASGGMSAPLFSPGPSPAERRRDSAANVEYLARLQRLQERVAARRESLRVADSMSRARIP